LAIDVQFIRVLTSFRSQSTWKVLPSTAICAPTAVAIGLDFSRGPSSDFLGLTLIHIFIAGALLCMVIKILSLLHLTAPRYLSTIVYAATAFTTFSDLDSLYGANEVAGTTSINLAIAGAVLFAIASLLSLFTLRFGIACGLVALGLSGHYFLREIIAIPWGSMPGILPKVLPYARWSDIFASLIMMVTAVAYSLSRLWLLFRAPTDVY